MKILVFSDTHLSHDFNEKKYRFLKSIILNADKVIINGDFWEGFRFSFNQFIRSPWRHLFPLLKKKGTVYIFGNHDKKEFTNEKADLFSDLQTEKYRMKLNGNFLVLEHGHRLTPIIDDKIPSQKILKIINHHMEFFEKSFIQILGIKLFKKLCGQFNKKIKNKIKKELTAKEILICGHTHSAEVDLPNKFVNSGMIKHGIGQYLLINTDKKNIQPIEEYYFK